MYNGTTRLEWGITIMKILAIGNSFSEDATCYLQRISQGELYVRLSLQMDCSSLYAISAVLSMVRRNLQYQINHSLVVPLCNPNLCRKVPP